MRKKSLTNKAGEVRGLTRADIRAMRPAGEVLPSSLVNVLPKRKQGQRGAQKQPTKVSVTLRYSSEVIHYFRATGRGWQTLMDEALKDWIVHHPMSEHKTL
jgi:uncharacterized protein (DUF4415 family)